MPSVRLFIGNLPYQATEDDLRTHFSAVGEPTQIVRPLDRETGRARGFAFVEYADRAVAEEAVKRFDGQLMMGRPLAVSEARARDDRGPMGPRPSGPGGPGGPPRPGGFAPRPGGPGGPGMGPGGPRPGGGFGPRPGGAGGPSGPGGFPRPGGFGAPRPAGPGGAVSTRESNFGPPAPPKGKGPKKDYRKDDAKPRGPIPTKFTGRMYDLDEVDADETSKDELPEFMKHEAAEDEPAVDTAPETAREDGEPDDRGR